MKAWVSDRFAPLPALIEAARLTFERLPFPHIKRPESAKIPETVDHIQTRIRETLSHQDRLRVHLAGVPGFGKTPAGLQLVHAQDLQGRALFLFGNGPLMRVPQYSLGRRRKFVYDARSYLRDHRNGQAPREQRLCSTRRSGRGIGIERAQNTRVVLWDPSRIS